MRGQKNKHQSIYIGALGVDFVQTDRVGPNGSPRRTKWVAALELPLRSGAMRPTSSYWEPLGTAGQSRGPCHVGCTRQVDRCVIDTTNVQHSLLPPSTLLDFN